MPGILKKTDVDQAKLDLKRRRLEILARQAEEGQALDAERAELDRLNDLIDGFTQKFMTSVVFAHKQVATPIAEPVVAPVVARVAAPVVARVAAPVVARVAASVAHQNVATKAAAMAGHHRPRAYQMSNFAEYTRAMTRV